MLYWKTEKKESEEEKILVSSTIPYYWGRHMVTGVSSFFAVARSGSTQVC